METRMQIKGTVKFIIERGDGSKVEIEQSNLVVDYGLQTIAALISGQAQGAGLVTHLALGTGNTVPTTLDAALIAEVRRDAVSAAIQAAPNQNKVEFKVTHALGAVSGTFEEAGLFDAATGGNMFNRTVFNPFPVTVADTLTVIWIVEVRNV